ncbi:hypothetical protein NHX12_026299 [Muraenolepis orangiensis]|uniref:Frizzled-3 n=1 Tax=Muraenolepis orangiensis TaxID=630683 RepID=A0A9Q0EGA0_9TELE|nr:hypothetical protein NHX12_026299 [Muraenolepis orangiensis]
MAAVLRLLAVAWALAACAAVPSMEAGASSHSMFTCEPITLRMCQGLPYNATFMPNALNHYDQQTAALAMECSQELRMFLCALYAPVCTEYGRVTLPCRRLCQRALSDCYRLMDMFGVSWPPEMDCSRFPDCEDPYPRAVDLLSSSEVPSPEAPGAVQRDYGFWCPRELKMDPDLGYSFMDVRDCSPPCPNMYFGREELALARYFIGVVSILCLSATLFTFLTFLIDVSRFRYPERPIIFYAVCYMMVSLAFFLGFLLDDRVACNPASPGRFRATTVTQGSHNKACTLIFMVLYFFTMAGSVWWVVLTVTWFLAAVPKWGSEAIEKKALLFHACAWGLPGALTVTLMAMNKIEGDSISGVCFVGLYDLTALRWFLLAPLGLDVVVGVALLLAGIFALNRVRMEIPLEKENQEKLVKFMIRIGVFSVLYLVPLLIVLACYLYESSHRQAWDTTWVQERCKEYHIPCPYQYLMMLIVGIPSVFWVGSKKTCFEWARFFHGKKRKDRMVHKNHEALGPEPDFAQLLLREPGGPIVRKSRGTSTQGTSTHASSTHLAMLDQPASGSTSRAGSMRSGPSKSSGSSYRGSLHRDGRYTASGFQAREEGPPCGSLPRLKDQSQLRHCSDNRLDGTARHGSTQRLESGQSRQGSVRDLSAAPPAFHGVHRVLEEDGARA